MLKIYLKKKSKQRLSGLQKKKNNDNKKSVNLTL